MYIDNEYSYEIFQTFWQYPILVTLHKKVRSNRPGVFCKKGVFENFAKQKCFPVNFAKFSRTPPAAASEKLKAEAVPRRCSVKKVFLQIFAKFTGKHLCQSLFFTAFGMQLY